MFKISRGLRPGDFVYLKHIAQDAEVISANLEAPEFGKVVEKLSGS